MFQPLNIARGPNNAIEHARLFQAQPPHTPGYTQVMPVERGVAAVVIAFLKEQGVDTDYCAGYPAFKSEAEMVRGARLMTAAEDEGIKAIAAKLLPILPADILASI